jgi:hypothetical protein
MNQSEKRMAELYHRIRGLVNPSLQFEARSLLTRPVTSRTARSAASEYLTILSVTDEIVESTFGQILFTIRDHEKAGRRPYAVLMHPETAYDLMVPDSRWAWGTEKDGGYSIFGLELIVDKGIAEGDFIVVSR